MQDILGTSLDLSIIGIDCPITTPLFISIWFPFKSKTAASCHMLHYYCSPPHFSKLTWLRLFVYSDFLQNLIAAVIRTALSSNGMLMEN